MKILNSAGKVVDFEAAVALMDDEIREALAADGIDSEQDFFAAYCKAHLEKYGEVFEPDKANGQW